MDGFIRVASKVTRERAPGVLLGILGGGVPASSPNPDPISHQKSHLSSLLRLKRQQKNSHFSFFLIFIGD